MAAVPTGQSDMRRITCYNAAHGALGQALGVSGRKPPAPPQAHFALSPSDYIACVCGCLLWRWSVNSGGYGKVTHASKLQFVGRILLGITETPLYQLHSCANPGCVNIEHLRAGTHQDNVTDMVIAGRNRYTAIPGERNGSAKLTDLQVAEIRRRHIKGVNHLQPGNTLALAQEFGVSRGQISRITTAGAKADTPDNQWRSEVRRRGQRAGWSI